jgi:hypothetical protein
VEHLLVPAVESVGDRVLAILDKGNTREDFFQVVRLFDEVGLSLSPTFVAFTPWTTLDGYLNLLKVIAGLGLIRSVASVQLAIRLLIPPGSRLLELAGSRPGGPARRSGARVSVVELRLRNRQAPNAGSGPGATGGNQVE